MAMGGRGREGRGVKGAASAAAPPKAYVLAGLVLQRRVFRASSPLFPLQQTRQHLFCSVASKASHRLDRL